MEIEQRERLLRDAVLAYPAEVRRALKGAIMAARDQRAAAIGRLWALRPGGPMAELLISVEEDRQVALDVAMALKGWSPASKT